MRLRRQLGVEVVLPLLREVERLGGMGREWWAQEGQSNIVNNQSIRASLLESSMNKGGKT